MPTNAWSTLLAIMRRAPRREECSINARVKGPRVQGEEEQEQEEKQQQATGFWRAITQPPMLLASEVILLCILLG